MITVEDFNSVFKEYGYTNIFHEIDTSLISADYDYDDIQYDFCKVSRETTDVDEYTFQFNIVNAIWTGGYYFTDVNDEYLDITATWDSTNKILTVVTSEPTVKLYLYLTNLAFAYNNWGEQSYGFNLQKLTWKPTDLKNIYFSTQYLRCNIKKVHIESLTGDELSGQVSYYKNSTHPSVDGTDSIQTDDEGYYFNPVQYLQAVGYIIQIRYDGNYYYFMVYDAISMGRIYFKDKTLFVGKLNEIQIGIGIFLVDGILSYLDKSELITYVPNRINTFNVDLRNVYNTDKVAVKLHNNPVNGNFEWDYGNVFQCEVFRVSNLSDFVSECGNNGTGIFELGSDLTLTSDVAVTHNLTIYGKDYSIDLDGHSLIVPEGVKLILNDCNLINGDNAIVQQANSELELTNISFTNCESTEYSNLGSCIYCDIDLDSLEVEDDFKTTLNDCLFVDNHSAIFHGGNLIMNGCKLHNTDLDYIDKHNVALLYQTDGNATIRNCILDIDYTDTALCTNEESIGFAQCLFRLGETARINGHTYTDIRDNGIEITSNACHIFAKYYYTGLEECVFTSPVLDKEDSAFCYALTGLNKVFKHNVKITKASDNAENTYRKIEW